MSWQYELAVAVASGLLVPAMIALAQLSWTNSRVPTALARAVPRDSYLDAIRNASNQVDVVAVDVLAPHLPRADTNRRVADTQAAWRRINARGRVRVITIDSEECLQAGMELLQHGIEVRIADREIGVESLTYHVFRSADDSTCTAIVNHRQGDRDQPIRLTGVVPAQPFFDHFEQAWSAANPLESVLAAKIVTRLPAGDAEPVLRRLEQVSGRLDLGPLAVQRVLPHLAFHHNCSIVFVVGPPGAGKSLARRRLAAELGRHRISTESVTDRVFAYRDFIHDRIRLDPPRAAGFTALPGGHFSVPDEQSLEPALDALAQTVRERMRKADVLLVEFSRDDLHAALRQFEDLRSRAFVMHVNAPPRVRAERIARRVGAPEVAVNGQSIAVSLSDDYHSPRTSRRGMAERASVDRLVRSRRWLDRMIFVQNDDDDDGARIQTAIDELLVRVMKDYRPRLRGAAA